MEKISLLYNHRLGHHVRVVQHVPGAWQHLAITCHVRSPAGRCGDPGGLPGARRRFPPDVDLVFERGVGAAADDGQLAAVAEGIPLEAGLASGCGSRLSIAASRNPKAAYNHGE